MREAGAGKVLLYLLMFSSLPKAVWAEKVTHFPSRCQGLSESDKHLHSMKALC